MPYSVSKTDVWTAEFEDQVGGLAGKLGPLAGAGVDLEFVIGRRQPHKPGRGVVFLSGISGAKASKAATAAGLVKAGDLAALRVEGVNRPGTCHQVTQVLADAGINLRGLSASVIGSRWVVFLAFDSAGDADKAARLLRAAGGKKR